MSEAQPTGFAGRHRLDAQPRDAAARVPAHRDRQRRRAARRHVAALAVGEPRRRSSYETRLARRRCRCTLGAAAIAQDLRHWVNSGLMTFFFFVVGLEARREFDMGELRERRRAALPLVAGLGGMVVPVADLPRVQRRPRRRARLGRRDVDRHRVRARHARARRAALPRPPARLHAHGRRRRRPGRPGRHRDRLHARTSPSAPARRARLLSCAVIAGARGRRRLRRSSTWPWALAAWVALYEVGRRPGRGRARHGAAGLRLPRRRGPTSSARASASGSSASSRRPSSPARRAAGVESAISPNERLAAALPPLDELRHRAAVRARERRHPDQRRLSRARLHVADHARDPGRLRGRQAGRHRRRVAGS